jgi:3-deoxy-D-manno-octulosonate 8-phosphate phosphatase (KDO 8-P phosphatase)
MAFFKEELLNVKAFILDVDGVLSSDMSPVDPDGEPMRTTNVKDGYAIRIAVSEGFPVAIISGARNENIRKRYSRFGVEPIYLSIDAKLECFNQYIEETGIDPAHIMYMGDDLADYEIMSIVGVPTCPADAVTEIKSVSKYISDRKGGEGCVRDVIEQVLRAQGKWITPESLKTSAF